MSKIIEYKKNIWLTEEEKDIVKKSFFPDGATDDEIIYCMKVAESFGLNPILKQIHFVPRKSQVKGKWITKIEPLAGRDSFLTLAHRSGKFDGLDTFAEIKDMPYLDKGTWKTKKDLFGVAIVYKSDTSKPFKVEVSYSEYVQKKTDGTITKFWLEKPQTMIKKVAESQALRKAFDISGLYSEEEINQNDDVTETKIEKTEDISREFATYLIRNNIPQPALQQFSEFCLENGFDLKDDKVKKELLSDKEQLNKKIESFLDIVTKDE